VGLAVENWSLLVIIVFTQRVMGVWHRGGKSNQLINSMREEENNIPQIE